MRQFGDVDGLIQILSQINNSHSILNKQNKEARFIEHTSLNNLKILAKDVRELKELFEEQKNYTQKFEPLKKEPDGMTLTLKDRPRINVASKKKEDIKKWASNLVSWQQKNEEIRKLNFKVTFLDEEGIDGVDGSGVTLEYINLLFNKIFIGNSHMLSPRDTTELHSLYNITAIAEILRYISHRSDLKTGRCFSLKVFKALCECSYWELAEFQKNFVFRSKAITESSSPYHRLCRRIVALDSESEQTTSNLMLDLLADKANYYLYTDEMDCIAENTEEQSWAGESLMRQRVLKDQLYIKGASAISKDIQGEYNRKKLCDQIFHTSDKKEDPIYMKRVHWMFNFLKVGATEKEVENFLIFATGSSSNPSEKLRLYPATTNKPLLLTSQACFNQVYLNSTNDPKTETKEEFFACIRKSIDPDYRAFGLK
jgi:hypothetical protein